MDNILTFDPRITVAPEQVVAAARCYLGVPYSRKSSWIEWDMHQTKPSGRLSCFGLFLQVAKDLRLLDSDFDINLSPANFGGRRPARVLREILEQNFQHINAWDRDFSDVLIFRFQGASSPHHVGILSGENTVIHAIGQNAIDSGCVCEQRLDALMQRSISEVWRLRNLVQL